MATETRGSPLVSFEGFGTLLYRATPSRPLSGQRRGCPNWIEAIIDAVEAWKVGDRPIAAWEAKAGKQPVLVRFREALVNAAVDDVSEAEVVLGLWLDPDGLNATVISGYDVHRGHQDALMRGELPCASVWVRDWEEAVVLRGGEPSWVNTREEPSRLGGGSGWPSGYRKK